MARHKGQDTIRWTTCRKESLAQALYSLAKSNDIEKITELSTIPTKDLVESCYNSLVATDPHFEGKKGGVKNMAKWAISAQKDSCLVKTHPQGFKYKTQLQYSLQAKGMKL